VKSIATDCVEIRGPGYPALQLAVQITRWKLIAKLEVWPEPGEDLPLEVRHARDRELLRAAA
jgi:hypothetical protein